MNISMQDLKELLFNENQKPETVDQESVWEIGEPYLIRTVTMMLTGRLEKITNKELLLSDGCWIADSGRFHDALKNGIPKHQSSEIEPFTNPVIVGRGSIIDATTYPHDLKMEQK